MPPLTVSRGGLTVTATGCHVWPGDERHYPPCFKHGTAGCCLIAHRSPAAQRAANQPRCGGCGQFLRNDSYYTNRCSDCWTPEDESLY